MSSKSFTFKILIFFTIGLRGTSLINGRVVWLKQRKKLCQLSLPFLE